MVGKKIADKSAKTVITIGDAQLKIALKSTKNWKISYDLLEIQKYSKLIFNNG